MVVTVLVFEGDHQVFGDEIARESVTLPYPDRDVAPRDVVRDCVDRAVYSLEP